MIKHLPHFVTLIGILLVGFSGLVMFSNDKGFQLSIATASASAYVAWGVVHHLLHKDFQIEILFEYMAVAALGLVIIFSSIIRS